MNKEFLGRKRHEVRGVESSFFLSIPIRLFSNLNISLLKNKKEFVCNVLFEKICFPSNRKNNVNLRIVGNYKAIYIHMRQNRDKCGKTYNKYVRLDFFLLPNGLKNIKMTRYNSLSAFFHIYFLRSPHVFWYLERKWSLRYRSMFLLYSNVYLWIAKTWKNSRNPNFAWKIFGFDLLMKNPTSPSIRR